jgi:hypothetical protein
MPIAEGVRVFRGRAFLIRAEEAEQPARATPGVHPGKHPLRAIPVQLQVRGPYQPGVLHVDQPMAEHVRAEQNLALAPFELAQVQLGGRELEDIAVKGRDLLERDVDLAAPADAHHNAGDQRVVRAAEPDDHVGQPPERLPAVVHHGTLEQLG